MQRYWAEVTLDLFERYYASEWYPAEIIGGVVDAFPDLQPRAHAHAQDWGPF